VALLADALHNFSDALAFILALIARRIARRPAHPSMSFGYGRAEVVAALINYTALVMIALWLGYEAAARLLDPPSVAGRIVIALAALGVVMNGGTALLTFRLARDSANIRAAFLHNSADAATSLAVLLAGIVIQMTGWHLVDPLLTLAISGWILWHAVHEMGPVIRILMLAAPEGAGAEAIAASIRAEPGVAGLHHLHLWQIDERRASVEAHLVLTEGAMGPEVLARVKGRLARDFSLTHSTFEMEVEGSPCAAADCG
ncbi:MAG: cation diffusion facilitator family transporter, partial [Rhodobacteraceae bacterium]|nr:cation diffusion facilitator family transporter [Paracoccaceae bacterium]